MIYFLYMFCYQAVITVNLTSMLVLTTIFIDVSNNLPKTSYIKMVDIWLLFNLLLPFLVVLIHTRMDTLRMEEEDIVTKQDRQVKRSKNKKLDFWKKVSLVYNPIIFITFVMVYWLVGLKHAEAIQIIYFKTNHNCLHIPKKSLKMKGFNNN